MCGGIAAFHRGDHGRSVENHGQSVGNYARSVVYHERSLGNHWWSVQSEVMGGHGKSLEGQINFLFLLVFNF